MLHPSHLGGKIEASEQFSVLPKDTSMQQPRPGFKYRTLDSDKGAKFIKKLCVVLRWWEHLFKR